MDFEGFRDYGISVFRYIDISEYRYIDCKSVYTVLQPKAILQRSSSVAERVLRGLPHVEHLLRGVVYADEVVAGDVQRGLVLGIGSRGAVDEFAGCAID